MAKISQETIKKVTKGVDITSLARDYFSLVKKGNCYQIESDNGQYDSVMIYPETNSFFRWSSGVGGDVIKFVTELEIEGNKNFRDAVLFLQKRIDPTFLEKPKIETVERKQLSKIQRIETLNKQLDKDENNKNAIAYLINERGIDKSLVYEGIKYGDIIQVKTFNGSKGVAFLGKDSLGLLACATVRGINNNSSFKGELKGCDYNVGWRWFPKTEDGLKYIDAEKPVVCFESYIDMLSYMTIKDMLGGDHNDGTTFISTGSATKYKTVIEFAKENPKIQNYKIAFDNDEAGNRFSQKLAGQLKELGKNVVRTVSREKDWNDELKKIKGIDAKSIEKRRSEALTKFTKDGHDDCGRSRSKVIGNSVSKER